MHLHKNGWTVSAEEIESFHLLSEDDERGPVFVCINLPLFFYSEWTIALCKAQVLHFFHFTDFMPEQLCRRH